MARLWEARSAGVDAVFARRTGAYEAGGRLLTSRVYRRTLGWVGGLPYGACLFVLLGRPMIEAVAATRSPRIAVLAVVAGAGQTFRDRSRATIGAISRTLRVLGWWAARQGRASLWQTFLARRLRRSL